MVVVPRPVAERARRRALVKVLVVRFAAIGDCVMSAWAVTALRAAVPGAEIVWAVQERCAPVVDTRRLVDRLAVVPRERWKRRRWSPATWREQVVTYTRLRQVGFDVGFDFQGHSKTALMLRLSGARERLASRATDALARRLNPPRPLSPESPHEVHLALALVRERFPAVLPDRPVMPIDGPPTPEPGLVTLQTGAGEADKLYPAEQWAAVAQTLADAGLTVVSLGAENDPKVQGTVDEVGRHDLLSAMGRIAASRLHLAADTGTGHMAAALGVPVVSVFGRTDPARFRPFTQAGRVLRGSPGPGAVAPADVAAAALELLEATSPCAC